MLTENARKYGMGLLGEWLNHVSTEHPPTCTHWDDADPTCDGCRWFQRADHLETTLVLWMHDVLATIQ